MNYAFQSENSFNSVQEIITQNSTTALHEQEIQVESIESIKSYDSGEKSKVWDYFTKPYDHPKSYNAKCYKCGMEFSCNGQVFPLKYHLINLHGIDISTNLSQIKKQLRQISSERLRRFSQEDFFTVVDKLLNIDRNEVNNNNEALIIRGRFYQKARQYKESLADLNKVLKIEPNNTNALTVRGETYQKMGYYKKSIADLNRTLTIESFNINAFVIRGRIYRKMYKYEKSIADLSRALTIEPSNLRAWRIRGLAHREIGKYEESIADFSSALKINPNDLIVLINRGKIYQKVGKYEESIADFNRILEIEPNNARALKFRRLAYIKMRIYCRFSKLRKQ